MKYRKNIPCVKMISAIAVSALLCASTSAVAQDRMAAGKLLDSDTIVFCDLGSGGGAVARLKFKTTTLKQENVERLSLITATAIAANAMIGVAGKSNANKMLVATAIKESAKGRDVPIVFFDDTKDLEQNEVRVVIVPRAQCRDQSVSRQIAYERITPTARDEQYELLQTSRVAPSPRTANPAPTILASEFLYRADGRRSDIFVAQDKEVPNAIVADANEAARWLRKHGCDVSRDDKGWHIDCQP